MLVKNILERREDGPLTVRPNDTAHDVAVLLVEREIGAAVVAGDEGEIVGIVSERDIIRAYAKHEAKMREQSVKSLMMSPVLTCSPDTKISDVAQLMDACHIRHVPVVEGTRLIGVVSIRDIVTRRLSMLEADVEVLRSQLLDDPAPSTGRCI